MILYFRRERDGAIITRELAEAAGVRMRVSPPAGAVPIDPDVALAELAELEARRTARREAERAVYAESRRGAFEELLALGLSPAAASAISGHRRVIDLEPVDPLEVGGGRGR